MPVASGPSFFLSLKSRRLIIMQPLTAGEAAKSLSSKYYSTDDSFRLVCNEDSAIKVPFKELTIDLLFLKNIHIYGGSGSGKSYLLKDMIYTVESRISNYLVFAPSNDTNNIYTGCVPNRCIKTVPSEEDVKRSWTDQEQRARLYTYLNREEEFKTAAAESTDGMFKHPTLDWIISFMSATAQAKVKDIVDLAESRLRVNLERAKSRDEANAIKSKANHACAKGKKKTIAQYRAVDLSRFRDNDDRVDGSKQTYNDIYKLAKFVQLHPCQLHVKDDVTEYLKKWTAVKVQPSGDAGETSAEMSVMEAEAYRGRHVFKTIFTSIHAYSRMDKSIRQNAHVVIFTELQAASDYIQNNPLMKQNKKQLLAMANTIFADSKEKDPSKRSYIKAMMIGPDMYYIKAQDRPTKKVRTVQWKIEEAINRHSDGHDFKF